VGPVTSPTGHAATYPEAACNGAVPFWLALEHLCGVGIAVRVSIRSERALQDVCLCRQWFRPAAGSGSASSHQTSPS
jgi:hypothetical protein